MTLKNMLQRSAVLEKVLIKLFELEPSDDSERVAASRIMCSVAFEHAESAKMLIAAGNFTSAICLVRLQYEALVRAMWLLYAASDKSVAKLMGDLNEGTAKKADKLPFLSEMLNRLEGKVPEEIIRPVMDFREYSWRPISSYVHGGVHAMNRHSKGYPVVLLEHILKASNGVSMLVSRVLLLSSTKPDAMENIHRIKLEFIDCFLDSSQGQVKSRGD